MKVVILAGGMGTRFAEETAIRPKPMIEIGGKPILWHIMKIYSSHGFNDFVICLGYRGYLIKEYFANYFLHQSDVTFDLKTNKVEIHQTQSESWRVTLVDTGEQTMTGGRLKLAAKHVGDEDFCLTYGDGLSNLNIADLVKFHRSQKTLATVTAVQPPGRFGRLNTDGVKVVNFKEKPQGDGAWINGGFFVLSPKVIDYIDGPATVWEQDPMIRMAQEGQLSAFKHPGFWQPMDTLRDKNQLEELWVKGMAPWKIWN
jgi:glucose-1-phosphate cytidylyltransferase